MEEMLQERLRRLQDPVSILPPEVALEIFSYLTPEELLVIRQVNKLWNELANSECLWRKFCEEKELLDYTATVAYDKTPINNFCNSAKTYLSFEKTLKNNWISGRSHVLSELSSAITESLICWKRTFVRTYTLGTVFDIFTVDSQCNVHRLQRIDTRLNLEGFITASLNENWLGITRLNALLLYQRDSSGEYNLKWILMLMKEESLILRYLYVNIQTLDKQIDEFIKKNLKQYWEVSCMCLYPNYVWIWIEREYLIIKLEHYSKEAVISHKFGSDFNEICYDKKGIAVIQYDKVGIYEPDATLKFIYSVDEYRTVEHEEQLFDGLTQSPTSVAFIDKTYARSMIILDRKNFKMLRMNDLFPLLVALHPSKPLAFALFYMYSNGPCNRMKNNDELWTMRCYSCTDGQIIWENSQMTYLPDIHKFLVINKKFLLLTPVRPGLCKFSFFDCSSGKLLSIIEEDSHPFLTSKTKTALKTDVKDKRMEGPIINLELNKGENRKKELFRIRKGYQVKFKPGPSLYGCNFRVYTNLPEDVEQKFDRTQYRLVKDNILVADRSGSFHYYFVIGTSDYRSDAAGEGYVLVEPNLMLEGEELPLDCIQCVTVLSKCLGPMSTWNDRLSIAVQSGYNMVHFTPIQKRGKSNSAYSISDQLSIDPSFADGPFQTVPTMEQVEIFMKNLRKEHKMLSICDVVLNHTATEAEWLQNHPECAYNLVNTPHLRPAYFLDRLLKNFSKDIANGMYETYGLPAEIETEDHLQALRYQLGSVLLPAAKIVEFFIVDTKKLVIEFSDRSYKTEPSRSPGISSECKLKVIQDPHYGRLTSTVDMDLALNTYNIYRSDCYDEDTRKRRCAETFKRRLEQLNDEIQKEIDTHLSAAIENTVAQVRYFRIQNDGPKLGPITAKHPLVTRYFVDWKATSEDAMYNEHEGAFIMAHNGWVMDYDPLQNFAEPASKVYLRRELIPWTDSVKLRYGEKREDCPYLWDHMERYVLETARIFDGIRLDNCHSTPIHVAQYLLDSARTIKPDLYVVAELFTNSDLTDNLFVNKLGITSLIRECMSAWDSHEVGRLVYRFGGWSIGSLSPPSIAAAKIAHALFIDQTHDNPSPILVRSVFDLLPSSALVCMAACAVGSTMGYDQLVPHQIDVVKENRLYMQKKELNGKFGICFGKRAFNKLHYNLAREGYNQVFVDQIDREIVCVTRQNPHTLDSVLLFAHNSFSWPDVCSESGDGIGKGITVDGIAQSVILEAWLTRIGNDNNPWYAKNDQFKKNHYYINGLDEYKLELKEGITVGECTMARIAPCGHTSTRIDLTKAFRPGAVFAIKIVNRTNAREAADKLYSGIHEEYLDLALQNLNLIHINHILYKCSEEEEGGSYYVPNFGKLVYCGLQGIMSVLEEVFKNEDLGHPVCDNIRNGPWLGEYTANRLKKLHSTSKLGHLLEQNLKLVEELPRGYRPWGIYRVLSQVYQAVLRKAFSLMSEFIKNGDELTKELALVSIQMCGAISSAPLPPLSERISPSKRDAKKPSVTLAAGLPHFSTGYMRSWGRDTFISLRGLLLVTGRFDEARYLILGYGACLRHGLIPNLLNGGDLNPRYNCRDAVWWWLHSIKEYCMMVPKGYKILYDPVNRLFPNDDMEKPAFQEQELHNVMQEALNIHFQGLCFRERNAGPIIDRHMTSRGFDNQIGVHPNTGFVFGGNEWNCGTWMDKMGSSNEAGTMGRPATPRDGAAIEIVGLSMAVISWLENVSPHLYPHSGVTRVTKSGDKVLWTWGDWAYRIMCNFETEFYIPAEYRSLKNENDKYIHKRGIYKDTFGATQPWSDYRLRPNFFIAMVVAPDLFSPSNAQTSLNTASILLGPLGIKTLDPDDLAYCGNYDNSNHSSDFRVAHGYNYHQGPEWLWPTGYYLRALLKTSEYSDDSVDETRKWLGRLWSALRKSDWQGLPELTNENGVHCLDSCPTQAWSAATILEVLYDLHQYNVNKAP